MINYIVSECSKLAQKEYDKAWQGRKDDPLGIVQKLKFDHTTKCLMHKPESVLENLMQKMSGILR